MHFGAIGSGDIFGVTKAGTFFSIEVKAPGKKATTAQLVFMEAVRGTKGIAFVADDLDQVIKELFPDDVR